MIPLADLVATTYEKVLRETPWDTVWDFWGPPMSYRARLDRIRHNYFGDPLPRIVVVRGNLQRMKKPPRPPRIPA